MHPPLVEVAARQRVIDAAIDLAVGDIHDEEAFRKLIDAAARYLDKQRAALPSTAPRIPFGPMKGKPLSVLPMTELERLALWVTKALHDTSKTQFREANEALLTAIHDERHRRIGAH